MFRRLVPLLGLATACSAAPPSGPAPTPAPRPTVATPSAAVPAAGRLPGDVIPSRYGLQLRIDPSRTSFSGTVRIDVDLQNPRRELWLHGKGLQVTSAVVTPGGGDGSGDALRAIYREQPAGFAQLELPRAIEAGPATVRLDFSGRFSTRTNSLYRVESGGDAYAFTQMEPVWARQAFPCFDEPAFKTPWDVSLVVPKGQVAIANTQETKRTPTEDGMVRIEYAPTEPLPTYLIAFAVGPLDVVEAPAIAASAGVDRPPLPFRGVAARGRGPDLAYALKHTPALLEELETYFGVAYPYDKLDIIAVPDKGGAMENAGAITFREYLLLFQGDNASFDQRRAFAYVMAHELAHQWFGNLVTMPWWDDIWLNEAFATWMGYRVVAERRPDYDADVQLLTRVHAAMGRDRLVNARQIRQPVTEENDIHNAFDRITYRKGGGVLAMFERWMGPEVFRQGLQRYMAAHRHGSATAGDLLRAFSDAAGRDVRGPFDTFLLQPGLPEIRAEVSCEGTPELRLQQNRYLPLGSEAAAASSSSSAPPSWRIPVCLRYELAGEATPREQCELLDAPQKTISLPGCPRWLLPNADAAGYYTWSLDPEGLSRLAEARAKLTTREKISFGAAVRFAFDAGRIDAATAFDTLLPLALDPHDEVATAPMGLFARAHRMLEGRPEQALLEARARAAYAPVMKRLGYRARPDEPIGDRLLRARVVNFLLFVARDEQSRTRAAARGETLLNPAGEQLDRSAVDANLAQTVAMAFGMNASPPALATLRERLGRERDDVARSYLLAALSTPRDDPGNAAALGLSLDPILRVNERAVPLAIRMRHPDLRTATWSWLRGHVDDIVPLMAPRGAAGLPNLATDFCTPERAAEMQATFADVAAKAPGGDRELAKAVETVRLCAAAAEAQRDGLLRYLGGKAR
ncbi:MAG: M1 family metallopeptidase [Myxococcota bacterium]